MDTSPYVKKLYTSIHKSNSYHELAVAVACNCHLPQQWRRCCVLLRAARWRSYSLTASRLGEHRNTTAADTQCIVQYGNELLGVSVGLPRCLGGLKLVKWYLRLAVPSQR
jgi:hypothetical protein